jgi:hypothetical protein
VEQTNWSVYFWGKWFVASFCLLRETTLNFRWNFQAYKITQPGQDVNCLGYFSSGASDYRSTQEDWMCKQLRNSAAKNASAVLKNLAKRFCRYPSVLTIHRDRAESLPQRVQRKILRIADKFTIWGIGEYSDRIDTHKMTTKKQCSLAFRRIYGNRRSSGVQQRRLRKNITGFWLSLSLLRWETAIWVQVFWSALVPIQ